MKKLQTAKKWTSFTRPGMEKQSRMSTTESVEIRNYG